MMGEVSDWLSYKGGALIKVADSAGSTVTPSLYLTYTCSMKVVSLGLVLLSIQELFLVIIVGVHANIYVSYPNHVISRVK